MSGSITVALRTMVELPSRCERDDQAPISVAHARLLRKSDDRIDVVEAGLRVFRTSR